MDVLMEISTINQLQFNGGIKMCECIKDITAKLQKPISDKFSKPKNPVTSFYIATNLNDSAVVDITINLENQIKKERSYLVAEYCPWCGVKYEV